MMTASYYRWLIYSFPKCPRLLLSLPNFTSSSLGPARYPLSVSAVRDQSWEIGNLKRANANEVNGHRNIALNIIVVLLMFILRKNQVK
jgi:hypothetical protein